MWPSCSLPTTGISTTTSEDDFLQFVGRVLKMCSIFVNIAYRVLMLAVGYTVLFRVNS